MNFAGVGPQVRAARKKAALTQAELATRLGMSRATISQLENGTIVELGVGKLSRLCQLIGLEVVVRERTGNGAAAKRPEVPPAKLPAAVDRRAGPRDADAALAELGW